jgi:hypothetical protein
MKRFAALTAVLLLAATVALSASHKPSGQSNDGWIVLFDGKNHDNFSPHRRRQLAYRGRSGGRRQGFEDQLPRLKG